MSTSKNCNQQDTDVNGVRPRALLVQQCAPPLSPLKPKQGRCSRETWEEEAGGGCVIGIEKSI